MSQEARSEYGEYGEYGGYGVGISGTRRNIRIGDRRTSIKLEPEMWDALAEICARTEKSLNQICTEVYSAGHAGNSGSGNADSGNQSDDETGSANFTSELRVFILDYYRAIAHQSMLGQMTQISRDMPQSASE